MIVGWRSCDGNPDEDTPLRGNNSENSHFVVTGITSTKSLVWHSSGLDEANVSKYRAASLVMEIRDRGI